MANKICSVKVSLSFEGPNGARESANDTVDAEYQALSEGILDVPDAEASGTDHEIPFGSVGTGATALLIKNRTGQPLDLKLNGGSTVAQRIPDGKAAIVALAGSLGVAPMVTAAKLVTSAIQAGAGYIDYRVFGDPV